MSKGSKKKKDSLRRAIVRMFLVFSLLALGFVAFINRENLSPNNIVEIVQEFFAGSGSGGGFPVEIGKNNAIEFERLNNNVAMLNSTSFVMISNSGKELVNRQHGFNNPRMKMGKRKALIYDCGAKDIILESRAKTQKPFEVENNIITTGIGLDGTVAVVTESNKYLSEMTVYAQDFFLNNYKKIFKYNSSEYYIIDVAIRPDGKGAAVAAVSAVEGQIKSCVLVFDFNNSDPVGKQEFIGTMLLSICYTNNTIYAVGDNLTCSIRPDGSIIEKLDYTGNNLAGFCSDFNSGIALALSPMSDLSHGTIFSIDEKGNEVGNAQIEAPIRSISSNSNFIVVLTPSNIIVYDKMCNQINQIECDSDAISVVVVGNQIMILGKREIRQISVK